MSDHLRAADWQVLDVATHGEAVSFISNLHYTGTTANTSVYRHGLFRNQFPAGEMYGAALWMPPTKSAALTVYDEPQGVLCLSRLALDPAVPTNGASFLLGKSMRMIDRDRWPCLLTYADTRQGHTGAIYHATNWTCLGEVPGQPAWQDQDGHQRGAKRGPTNLSVSEMMERGFTKLKPCPKIKFVHVR